MDRVAVFVDAAYLSISVQPCSPGQKLPRLGMIINESTVVSALIELAEAKSGKAGSLLRVYWYDASTTQTLNAEHVRLSELDNVKLRLGVLNTVGQQKGLDSLIIRSHRART